MPRYFFDFDDGKWARDEEGSEFADADQAIVQAKRALPAIVLDHLPRSGDRHTVTMHVTDERRQPVYTAVLSFSGLIHSR